MKEKTLVTGAGGFIGHHLVKFLKKRGHFVRGVDIKNPEYEQTYADEFLLLDLRHESNALIATKGIDHVYNLAANMGGVGFIERVRAEILHDNVLIDANVIESARINGIKRYFYSSSACIYPTHKQTGEENQNLKESDAYPANPENEYGWEKLFAERLCLSYKKEYGLETRLARFHNVYGPLGTWQGGREKSPAALCRKIAQTNNGEIEIWGDGNQARSYCFIDDCIDGIYKLMFSKVSGPVNIGSNRLVTINQLVDIISIIAKKKIIKKYNKTQPQGVRVRNSDNTYIKQMFNWEPSISLEEGFAKTYKWIKQQVDAQKAKST